MTDQSQGPGWWLASDGKWYPPDQAPAVPPPETWAAPPGGPPPSPGMSTGRKVAIAVVGGVIGLVVVLVLVIALVGDEAEPRFERAGTEIEDDEPDDAAAPGAADVPVGYALIEGDGVSIAAPDDWQALDPEAFGMTPDELEAAFPDAPRELLEQATGAFEEGAKLFAFDVDDDFSSNVNIASFPGEVPLSLLEDQAIAQLEALGGALVSSDSVTVPAGEALRIEYTLAVAAPDGSSIRASGVQFYVVADGRTHVITVTTAEDVGELADAMIDTFRSD
jgi:hypothetical protein